MKGAGGGLSVVAPSTNSTSTPSNTNTGGKRNGPRNVVDANATRGPAIALTSDRKFASKAESRQAAQEKAAAIAQKRKRREGLERANPDAPVFMR